MTPDLALFATRLFSSVGLLPVWCGSIRQEVKAPEPNRVEICVLVALFDGSIRLTKKSEGLELLADRFLLLRQRNVSIRPETFLGAGMFCFLNIG